MALRLLRFLTLVTLLGVSSAVQATTLQAGIQQAFAGDDAGLRLLRSNGAELGPLLVVERLPSGEYAVEIELRLDGRAMRYPLKLRRDDGQWTLQWQPSTVFAAALIGITKSGALPEVPTTERWVDSARLPAFPIIATRKRFVTPFGEIALDDRGEESDPGDLEVSPALVRAAQSWITQVLDSDPGPAGIDLILDGELSWRMANKVLFNLASTGLYHVTVVTQDMGALRVASPARQAAYVMALYPLETGFGLRVAVDGVLRPESGCAPQMTTCVTDEGGVAAAVERAALGRGPVMFAASGELSASVVARFLAAFAATAQVAPHALLVGYVQK